MGCHALGILHNSCSDLSSCDLPWSSKPELDAFSMYKRYICISSIIAGSQIFKNQRNGTFTVSPQSLAGRPAPSPCDERASAQDYGGTSGWRCRCIPEAGGGAWGFLQGDASPGERKDISTG